MNPRRRWLIRLAPLVLAAAAVTGGSARANEDGARGGDWVVRLFKIEHQNAEAVANAIRPLGSGGREAQIQTTEGLDAISVRERPAAMAAIEQAIKQLDVPRPDLTIFMRVLIAGPQGPGNVPPDLQKVVRQLEQNLRFSAYHQVAAVTQRVRSGAKLESHGFLQLAPPVLDKGARVGYELEVRPLVTGAKKGARTIQLRKLKFELEGRDVGRADIETDIVVPEGEIVVVGTAALGDRAMVLVLWASVL